MSWILPGALSYRITEDEELLLAPAAAEMLGGANDGAVVFPGYQLSVSAIAEAFDSPLEIHLNTQPSPNLTFIGTIGGEKAVVLILTEPFPDDEHHFRQHPDGSWTEHSE
jgi:hypothetical protein